MYRCMRVSRAGILGRFAWVWVDPEPFLHHNYIWCVCLTSSWCFECTFPYCLILSHITVHLVSYFHIFSYIFQMFSFWPSMHPFWHRRQRRASLGKSQDELRSNVPSNWQAMASMARVFRLACCCFFCGRFQKTRNSWEPILLIVWYSVQGFSYEKAVHRCPQAD